MSMYVAIDVYGRGSMCVRIVPMMSLSFSIVVRRVMCLDFVLLPLQIRLGSSSDQHGADIVEEILEADRLEEIDKGVRNALSISSLKDLRCS